MTELFLNRQQVFLPIDAKIKMNYENVFIEKASTYSFDINIPLQGILSNQIVFKNINRRDVRKGKVTFIALLKCNNLVLMTGKAIVKKVTDKQASIQLVAGNSLFNFENKSGDEVFIDKLDLGEAPDSFYFSDRNVEIPMSSWGVGWWGQFAYLPVYNETAQELYNRFYGGYQLANRLIRYNAYKWCVMPWLKFILQAILQKTGYNVINNVLDGTFFDNIIICNANITTKYAQALPHWSINEFFEHLENTFSLVTIVDDYTKEVEFIHRDDFYTSRQGLQQITLNVVDEYESDIDYENSNMNHATENIGFSLSSSDAWENRKLSEDVRSHFPTLEYSDFNTILSEVDKLTLQKKKTNIFKCPTGSYIYWSDNNDQDFQLIEVDQFCDLIRNKDNEDVTELKIVPVAMRVIAEDCRKAHVYDGPYDTDHLEKVFSGEIIVPSMTGAVNNTDAGKTESGLYSVQDVLNGATIEDDDKEDMMQVALIDRNMGALYSEDGKQSVKYPMMFIDSLESPLKYTQPNREPWTLRLVGGGINQSTLGQMHRLSYKVDIDTEYIYKFISDKIHDPKNIFIIQNQTYICKRIEVQVTAKNFDKLQTGYFYRIYFEGSN